VLATARQQWVSLQRPYKFFGPLKCARTVSETTIKLCMYGDQTTREKFFLHSTVMLTCDLFMVDNLFNSRIKILVTNHLIMQLFIFHSVYRRSIIKH